MKFRMGSYLFSLKILSPDHRTPESFSFPPQYSFIQTFLRHFKLEQEELQVLTNHDAFVNSVQEQEPECPVRGLAFSEPIEVWHDVNHPTLWNRLRDLCWMLTHGFLPVRSVMHSQDILAISSCPRPGCGAPESVRHLLWECNAAVDLWATAGSLQFPNLPAREVLPAQLVLYGVSNKRKTQREEWTKQLLTLAATKDAKWTSRNLLVRRHRQSPPAAVIRMAAETVRALKTAGSRPRTQLQRSIACASSDVGAEATQERSRQQRPGSPGVEQQGGIPSERPKGVPRDLLFWRVDKCSLY